MASSPREQELLESPFLRQVSAQSRFVGVRAVVQRGEKEPSVEKALLLVAQAHRLGIVSFVDKQRIKDAMFEQGSRHALELLCSFPGGAKLVAGYKRPSPATAGAAPPPPASVCHAFTTSGGYVLRIATRDHNLLTTAVRSAESEGSNDEGDDDDNDNGVPSRFLTLAISHMSILSHTKTYEGLSRDTITVLQTPNAGGNSIHSEALSYEVLQSLIGACNVVPERAVRYRTRNCSIVDYVCDTAPPTVRLGVSVTRALALSWPGPHPTTMEDVESLVARKLRGLDRARRNVMPIHAWAPAAQILHIWVQSEDVLNVVRDTILTRPFPNTSHVLLTLCPNLDHVVFGNEDRYELPDPDAFFTERGELQRRDSRTFDELILRAREKQASLDRAAQRLSQQHGPGGGGGLR